MSLILRKFVKFTIKIFSLLPIYILSIFVIRKRLGNARRKGKKRNSKPLKRCCNWPNLKELQLARQQLNKSFQLTYGVAEFGLQDKLFMSLSEERWLIKLKEYELSEILKAFQPTLSQCIINCAFNIYKRFYMNFSVMAYNPREVYVASIWLACRLHRYHITFRNFIKNFGNGPTHTHKRTNSMCDIILATLGQNTKWECVMCKALPMLAEFKNCNCQFDVKSINMHCKEFLRKQYLTDTILLFSAKEIALAAILFAAQRQKKPIDDYIRKCYNRPKDDSWLPIMQKLRHIVKLVTKYKKPKVKKVLLAQKQTHIQQLVQQKRRRSDANNNANS